MPNGFVDLHVRRGGVDRLHGRRCEPVEMGGKSVYVGSLRIQAMFLISVGGSLPRVSDNDIGGMTLWR
jgi:hypothetical protein